MAYLVAPGTTPGTIPYRVIELLRARAGREIATAVLCEELELADPNSVVSCLGPARRSGAVKARKDGRLLFWSLGDGTPEARPEDEEPDQPLPRSKLEPVVRGKGPPQDDATMLFFRPPAEPETQSAASETLHVEHETALTVDSYVAAIGQDAEQLPAASMPFNACRYLDGSLIVVGVEMREDGAVIFAPKQAAELWKLRPAA